MSGGGSSVDLDVITAGAGDILAGKTGIDPEGEPLPGTLALTGNAQPQYVLEGQTFYSTDPKTIQNGSMPHLSNNTPVDFASGNTTPVIVCDAHFYDTNTDGVARMCFRYNGEAGYIVPNTLFGYPFSVNSILSFSVAVISGRRVTATWQNPIQAAGRPYSGVYIKYSTSGYPGTGGTQIYKGVGSNAASGGISTATFDLPNVGTTYYLSLYPYVTTSDGEYLGGVLNAQVTTGNTITNTYTSSTIVSVPTGYTLADIFCVGGGGGGSDGRGPNYSCAGGGGGGGGMTATVLNVAVSAGQSLAVIVGAGGAVSTSSNNGNGGASSVSRSGAVLCSANGGEGGEYTSLEQVRDGGDGGSGGGAGAYRGDGLYRGSSGSDGGNGNGCGNDTDIGRGMGQGRTTRAFGEPGGTIYSGGGGGGGGGMSSGSSSSYGGGAGGAGGGGTGGTGQRYATNGAGGSANTGGGGGGGGASSRDGSYAGSGATGGSGIVLIRFH